jgi:hypothetical protein
VERLSFLFLPVVEQVAHGVLVTDTLVVAEVLAVF